MSKNPSKVGFEQPNHGTTGSTTSKNKAKVGFEQPQAKAGKTTAAKNPGKLGFTQKSAPAKGSSTKKNAAKVGFEQPSHGGSAAMPRAADKQGVVQKKAAKTGKAPGSVGPSAGVTMKSVDDLMAYRKKKFGV